MEEKVYYKDDRAKITNLRVTCNHVTIPVDRIDHVDVDLKVNSLVVALIWFFLSFVLFYWYTFVPCLIAGIILVLASFAWLCRVYNSYVELQVTVGSKRVKLMDTGMGNREYAYKVADAIGDTIIEEQKLEEQRRDGSLTESQSFSPTETMRLRQMLKDYGSDDS